MGYNMRAGDTDKLLLLCEKFDQHVERFDQHEAREEKKFDRLIKAQEHNTAAIADLTANVSSLVLDTKDIIQLTRDFQGAARIGGGIKRFTAWCLGIGGAVGGIGLLLTYITDHLSKH
jgi:hypothetical protein